MVAINNDIRADITNAVLKHGFRDKLLAFFQLEAPLMRRVFERIYSAEVRAALKLMSETHKGSTYFRNTLPLNIAGARVTLGRNSNASGNAINRLKPAEVKLPGFYVPYSDTGDNPLASFEADDAFGAEVMEFVLYQEGIADEINTRRAEVTGILSEIRSDRQLRERWPEVMPIAEQFIKAVAKVQLPAVPLVNLNQSLGLPPLKEAA
ncbi:hypothetical protein SAMN03159338_1547 [Sphingomonas sp. NFR04]|uniref:Nmad5 family putative nucleotide modification protein n=1 Tax=Sphingomonas sp. NFR04 TaxID=1566283 RepID=UPI0008EE0854|nr:Nmad5 family putative nucleotide modification protein [Sphingomonas sp. NFR04]SFJ49129.1 hypothetical protein SAMN03159338_1547 [Sphingomonas sp. NFR04]